MKITWQVVMSARLKMKQHAWGNENEFGTKH